MHNSSINISTWDEPENTTWFPTNFTTTISFLFNSTELLLNNSTNDTSFDNDNSSFSFVLEAVASEGYSPTTLQNFSNSSFDNSSSSSSSSSSSNHTTTDVKFNLRHPMLGVLFAFLCVFTFSSNLLVIIAVIKERYLHSVTNYFIASLAFADCWIGVFVMPLGAVEEMLYNRWVFGQDMCDVWHSCDVLGSTASILNLCVISLDRYWAITDPITYPSKMTPKKAGVLIALVWFAALLISFPAIFWWRAMSQPLVVNTCIFTEDIGYVVTSSTISFFFPLIIMVFTYYRIYRAANEQTKSLRVGSKQVHAVSNTGSNIEVTLRIHRGGGSTTNGCHASPKVTRAGMGSFESEAEQPFRARRHMNPKNVSISQKLARISKERTAAKTLGIVMGVFILCWLPFFSTNVIRGICGSTKCIYGEHIVFPLVTWIGWINSCMNPAIYAHRSREFRRAFIRILCCSRTRRLRHYRQGLRSKIRDNDSRFSNHQSNLNSTIKSSKL